MEFRTKVNIPPFERKIDHTQNGLSLGSCFANNMAERLHRAKFNIIDNPFGVLFNPISIADTITRLHHRTLCGNNDLAHNNGLWSNFAFHGSFSAPDPVVALEAMNRAVINGAEALQKVDFVIITFGTAWIYELAGTPGAVVANCHKFPEKFFHRRRLTVAEIVARYNDILAGVLKNKHTIFTVSPVRHIKDGMAENTLSKAVLIEAVHELVREHQNANYFPAFEIMNDELRDYRFYADDMLHPSKVAVDYIWERFCDAALSDRARKAATEVVKIAEATEHRPLYPGTQAHINFITHMRERIYQLSDRYPEIDFSDELDYFRLV